MALYRRNPQVIEAVQFDPNVQPWPAGVRHVAFHQIEQVSAVPYPFSGGPMWSGAWFEVVDGVGNAVQLRSGDWLDVTGERARVIPREEFEALYEFVETVEERVRRYAEEVFGHIHNRNCPGTPRSVSGFNKETRKHWTRVMCDTCGAWQEVADAAPGVEVMGNSRAS